MLTGATPGRRQVLLGLAAGTLLSALPAASTAQTEDVVEVPPFRLRLPAPLEEVEPLPGWAWAGRSSGATVNVVGGLRAPSPDLVAAAVLGSGSHGRFPVAVTGEPAQSVRGADDHVVWSVEHRAGTVRTGVLVAVTSGGRAGALLVLGERGWSPGLRRTILAGVQVVGGA